MKEEKFVEYYICWYCKYKNKKWYLKKELEMVEEDYNHIDYRCPKCQSVIICSKKMEEK